MWYDDDVAYVAIASKCLLSCLSYQEKKMLLVIADIEIELIAFAHYNAAATTKKTTHSESIKMYRNNNQSKNNVR